MATKKELIKRKQSLAYNIRNIKQDFEGVLREDMPQDVIDEVVAMMAEMKEIQAELESREQPETI
jgi:hypothetical protein